MIKEMEKEKKRRCLERNLYIHNNGRTTQIGYGLIENLTQHTCIYLITNKLQIPALNDSHFAIGYVPSRALQDMTCHSVSPKSWIGAGITVGQPKANHLINLVNGQSEVHCSWIFASLHDDRFPDQFPSRA